MRKKPSVLFSNIVSAGAKTVTLDYTGWSNIMDAITMVCTVNSELTVGSAEFLRFGPYGYIDFNADL